MSPLTRMLTRTGLTAALGALAFAVPSEAAVKATCVFDMEAKATTTKNASPGGPPLKYVQLTGGKGTFTFATLSFTCVDVLPGKAGQNPSTGTVTASGTFRQSMLLPNGSWIDTPCGTAKVIGKLTSVTMDNQKYRVLQGKKFAIDFTAGHGPFFWHDAATNAKLGAPVPKVGQDDGDPKYPGKYNPNGPKNYVYGGQVQTTPSQTKDNTWKTPPPTDKCTKAFHITGTVLVDEA